RPPSVPSSLASLAADAMEPQARASPLRRYQARAALRLGAGRGSARIPLFALGLRRLLAVLGFVQCRELRFQVRMADKALRVGPVVLLAPVSLRLEVGRHLGVALRAHRFLNALL